MLEPVAYLMKRQMRDAWKRDIKRRKRKGKPAMIIRELTPVEAELIDTLREWQERKCPHVAGIDPFDVCAIALASANLMAHGFTPEETLREVMGGIPAESQPIPFVINVDQSLN